MKGTGRNGSRANGKVAASDAKAARSNDPEQTRRDIEAETRKQFAEMRGEILRRHRLRRATELDGIPSVPERSRTCSAD